MSLGFIGATRNPTQKKDVKNITKSFEKNIKIVLKDVSKKTTTQYTRQNFNWTNGLIIFNIILVFAHIGVLVYIVNEDFRFPMTFFYTRIKSSILDDFSCIYDYGKDSFNRTTSNSFCSDPSLTMTGNTTPPSKCDDILSGNNNLPGVTSSGSPLLAAYELTRYGQGENSLEYIDNLGRHLTKYILVFIESVTGVAHILYTILFIRLRREFKKEKLGSIAKWILLNGGLPIRWIEYSFTASVMTLFIANTANLFEFFGVLGLCLATFALMFFGGVAEYLSAHGKSSTAIMLIYIPSFAIFIGTWAPIVQSLADSVFQISCQTYEKDTLFTCAEPTCFGKEVPIPIFSLALLSLFCTFPLILIFKVYRNSGWFSYFDYTGIKVIRLMTFQPFEGSRLVCLPIYFLLLSIFRVISFLLFIFSAGFIAWFTLLKHVFTPFLPAYLLKSEKENYNSLTTILICEFLYALASATSKIFLAIFFTISFADRDW